MSTEQGLRSERIPQELKLIITLLRDHANLNESSYRRINWERFLNLALHHRVFPLLYKALNTKDKERYIPQHVMQSLAQYYQHNTFRMLHLTGEIEVLSQCFSEHHIRLLYLKGPLLGHDLYGETSLRTSSDIDLLVPMDRLAVVEELLRGQGYEKDDYIKTVLNDWKWRHHHLTFFHPDKRIKLEVHWRLHPGPGREPTFEELWARRDRSNLLVHPLYTLGKADLFYFLSTHGARHGWSRLRWLIDIKQLMNQPVNSVDIYSILKEFNSLHIGGQSLILVSALFRENYRDKLLLSLMKGRSRKLAQDAIFYLESMINLHDEALPGHISRYHKRHLYNLMSTRQKIFFKLSYLYPYPEDAEILPLPYMLHFLYFPLRPILWVWRKSKKHAYP